jgi:chromosome segregation ATPase
MTSICALESAVEDAVEERDARIAELREAKADWLAQRIHYEANIEELEAENDRLNRYANAIGFCLHEKVGFDSAKAIIELQSRIEAVRKCPEVVTINDDHRSHLYMEEEICLRKSDVLKALGADDE